MLNQGVNRTYDVPNQYENLSSAESRFQWILKSPSPVIFILEESVGLILDATKTTLSGALTYCQLSIQGTRASWLYRFGEFFFA